MSDNKYPHLEGAIPPANATLLVDAGYFPAGTRVPEVNVSYTDGIFELCLEDGTTHKFRMEVTLVPWED